MAIVKRPLKSKGRDPSATRAALVAAAAKIFRREGYFATDSNAIARAAGYAPGSFYKHFTSKAAIMLAVYEEYVEAEWAGVREASGIKPTQRLPAILAFIESFHREWAQFRTDLRTVARLEPAVTEALLFSRKRQLERLAEFTPQSTKRGAGARLMILALMERYADILTEAKAHDIPALAIRKAMERAISALSLG